MRPMTYSDALHRLHLTTDRSARFTAEVFFGPSNSIEFWVVDNDRDGEEVAFCSTLDEAIDFAHRATIQPAIATNDLTGLLAR